MSMPNDEFFQMTMDEIIIIASQDPELQDAISWLDKTDQYGIGLTFYEKCFQVLLHYNMKKRAKDWLDEKTNVR